MKTPNFKSMSMANLLYNREAHMELAAASRENYEQQAELWNLDMVKVYEAELEARLGNEMKTNEPVANAFTPAPCYDKDEAQEKATAAVQGEQK